MIASITELNLKIFFSLMRFIPHAIKSKNQADHSEGVISVSVQSSGLLTHRTLTVWQNKESMLKFVRSEPHLSAMKIFSKVASKSYTAHFEVTAPPTWSEALEYLRKHGREY